MPITTLFFDLDDTLYPSSCGVWRLIKDRMNLFMQDHLGIPAEQVPELRDQYFRTYGTTLRGLQANHHVDAQAYLDFVHDIPLKEHLEPDPFLRALILSLPLRKYIFTNADSNHAERVLSVLGLQGCFQEIIDIRKVDPWCKPMPPAFAIAQQVAGEPDPKCCVMIDDLPHTTRAARDLGFWTVLFGQSGYHPDADACLGDLRGLPGVLAEWNRGEIK